MIPDSKVHGANIGPTWVLSAPDGPHSGPMNLAIRGYMETCVSSQNVQPTKTILNKYKKRQKLEDKKNDGVRQAPAQHTEWMIDMPIMKCTCRMNLYIVTGAPSTDELTSWWRHDMETSTALQALCKGHPLVTYQLDPRNLFLLNLKQISTISII